MWRRPRVLLDRYAFRMLRFIHEDYGAVAVHEAWENLYGPRRHRSISARRRLARLLRSVLFHCWSPDPVHAKIVEKSRHGVIPTEVYLAMKGRRLDPLNCRYFEPLQIERLPFFECASVRSRTETTPRECHDPRTRGNRARRVAGAQRGDLLFGQLASVDRLNMLEASNGLSSRLWKIDDH